jgi:hypothetical protein
MNARCHSPTPDPYTSPGTVKGVDLPTPLHML